MLNNNDDRVIALAGILQAAHLVNRTAQHGMADQAALEASLGSVLKLARHELYLQAGEELPARTDFRVLRSAGGLSLLEARLHTGRTHQIRVHMAHIRHPLVGDPVYGRSTRRRRGMPDALYELLRSFPRQALHAARIELVHPGSGESVAFSAPLPPDLEGLLTELRRLAR